MPHKHTLTRRERLHLLAATIRGVLTGATCATVTWLLDHYLG